METCRYSPKTAKGMVMHETTTKISRQGSIGPSDRDARSPAWIHPPAMLPRLPKAQKTAARVASSDCLYHDPYMKCAPTLRCGVRKVTVRGARENLLCDGGKSAFEAVEDENLVDVCCSECDESEDAPDCVRCDEDVTGFHDGQE